MTDAYVRCSHRIDIGWLERNRGDATSWQCESREGHEDRHHAEIPGQFTLEGVGRIEVDW